MNKTANLTSDLYGDILENRPSKIFCVIFSLVTAPLVALLFFGIAWYERFGSDRRRTLINKLLSSQCWSVIQYFLLSQSLDVLVYIIGTLPEPLCLLQLIYKNALKTQVILFIDMGLFIQYMFMSQAFAEIRHFRKCLGNSGNAWCFLNCLGISGNA